MAFVGCNKNTRQPARQMRPYLAYLDVANGFAIYCARREDHASIGLLGTVKISFKLRVSQRVAEERGAPLNEIVLGWQPRNQSIEVVGPERAERNWRTCFHFRDHHTIKRSVSFPQQNRAWPRVG
jgi:hypothetical protein